MRKSELRAVRHQFALGALTVFSLVLSEVAGAQRTSAAEVDSGLLSAILKSAASDAGRSDFQVDPRPLTAEHTVYAVEENAIAKVSPVVVRRRIAVIEAAGFRTVDTTIVNESRNCLGTLVTTPVDPLRRTSDRPVVGCPETPLNVVVVGPLRLGVAVLPPDQVYDRETERAARGYWSARVIRTTMGHGRLTSYAADYVLTKRGGTWAVTKIVGLMYTD